MDVRQKYKITNDNDGGAGQGSILLSLSLFIILLAFFIVLNSISNYSEPKVEAAFESLDIAFASEIIASNFEKQNNDEREVGEEGKGDSLEDMQDILRSVLPGLNIELTENPNGGKVMAMRMKKDKFETLSPQLLPLFVRILKIKDGVGDYDLSLSSYVQNTLSRSAGQSFATLSQYKKSLVKKGVNASRVLLSVEKGNPAYLIFHFEKGL